MENFFMIIGFGFLLLCFAVVLIIIGIFGYFVYIKIEKIKNSKSALGKRLQVKQLKMSKQFTRGARLSTLLFYFNLFYK